MRIDVEFTDWLVSAAVAMVIILFALLLAPEPGYEFGSNVGPGEGPKRRGLFLRLFGGVIKALSGVFAALPLGERREVTRRNLLQAGRPGGLTPDEYYASKIVALVIAVLIGMFFDLELDASPTFAFVFAALGFFYPGIWLSGVIAKRRRAIFRDLPDTLDMLRLAVDAGLDLGSAMKVVVEKGRPGPLLYELETVEREMALGRTRREAFKNFADRIQMTEINAFVVALIQADQLGASIGPLLKVQSEVSRTRRWQVAETMVNKMPMKMLGPLVIFIFPASFIILFTPLLIQWMQGR